MIPDNSSSFAIAVGLTLFTIGVWRNQKISVLPPKPKKKRVLLIRHGQAEHNVFFESNRYEEARLLLDPALTSLGRQQATDVKDVEIFKDFGKIDLVVSSPLTRTVETTMGVMEDAWGRSQAGRKVLLHGDIQETGDVHCDRGRVTEVIQPEFGSRWGVDVFDFDWLHQNPAWHGKEGDWAHKGSAIQHRLHRFTQWLASRKEERIVVVAHHNVLLAMVGVSFYNAEVREFDLDVVDGVGTWVPQRPLVSTHDDQLSEQDHHHNSKYAAHCHEMLKKWGLPHIERLR